MTLIHLNIVSAPWMCSLKHLPQGPFCELAAPTAWELDGAHDAEHSLKTRCFIHCHETLLLPYFLRAVFEMLLAPSSTASLFCPQIWTITGCLERDFPTEKPGLAFSQAADARTCLLELITVQD